MPLAIPMIRYEIAERCMEQGDYAEAKKRFRELGDYRDAKEQTAEAQRRMSYEKGLNYLAEEQYGYAYDVFAGLGDYQDAEHLAAEATRLEWVSAQYHEAKRQYGLGLFVDAYQMLRGIEEHDYKDTAALLEEIRTGMYDMVQDYAAKGELRNAMSWLQELERMGEPRAKALREELRVQEHLELDYSFYNALQPAPVSEVTPETTAETYAHIFLDMYLKGETNRTLRLHDGAYRYRNQAWWDQLYEAALEGYEMADEWLPEYGTVYQSSLVQGHLNDYGYPASIELWTDNENPWSDEELRTHVEQFSAFCEESVRALNDACLLGKSMSHQQKAQIIYDWVTYYLNYDQTLEIHNPWIAIEQKLGVCESYTSIYSRMCNLAGVPTWSQEGYSVDQNGERTSDSGHVWNIQLDEEGNIFYTDVTWGDGPWRDFSADGSMEGFLDSALSSYNEEYLFWDYSNFWQKTLWSTHAADRPAEQIVATIPCAAAS